MNIEEKFRSYISSIGANWFHPENIINTIKNAFMSGAQFEQEELMRWNKPDVLPDKDMICLGKTKYNGEESYALLIYKSEEKMFINRQTFLPIMSPNLVGWREIHE